MAGSRGGAEEGACRLPHGPGRRTARDGPAGPAAVPGRLQSPRPFPPAPGPGAARVAGPRASARRLHALAAIEADGRGVVRARLQVEPVAGAELHVAVVGVVRDRAGQAEQDLVEPVRVPAVSFAGTVPPEPRPGGSLGGERVQRVLPALD